jgi:hypothetical protein
VAYWFVLEKGAALITNQGSQAFRDPVRLDMLCSMPLLYYTGKFLFSYLVCAGLLLAGMGLTKLAELS